MLVSARKLVLVIAVLPATAGADTWLSAEAPAAIPISDAQAGVFRAGVMPALGVYLSKGPAAIGARVRAGVLRNGPAPGDNLGDPGLGGLGTAGLAMRLAAHGAWAEAVVGGGVTGHDWVPAVEGGVGWSFARGGIDLGPSARYVHVVGPSEMGGFGSADLLLVGLDVQFGKARPVRAHRIVAEASAEPVAEPVAAPAPRVEPMPVFELDPDRELDRDSSCVQDPEGCPLGTGAIAIHDDRIVLDERVVFDLARARVRSRGRALIAEVVKLWHEHPDWVHLTIEGHTDVRGTDEYNQDLSERRAAHVRRVFLRLGVDPDAIDAVGFGRSRPRDPGMTEEAHRKNRRVEFVIIRREAR